MTTLTKGQQVIRTDGERAVITEVFPHPKRGMEYQIKTETGQIVFEIARNLQPVNLQENGNF